VIRFVLDASVALAWLIDHPTPKFANHVRQMLLGGSRAVVPYLWQIEIANGFTVAERRGLMTTTQTGDALQNLDIISAHAIETSREMIGISGILAVAREFGLTAYDSTYLETARREGLPLATLDRQLASAASIAGVEVLR
jgi:predicted nucleic acid-binding protein